MAILYEYYDTGDDGMSTIHGDSWKAQTFTPSLAHTIISVDVKCYQWGSPGILTVSIRATDENGHPTGEDLCSGTIDADTFTTDSAGEWYNITLGSGTKLTRDTKYAIVLRALNGDISNEVRWRSDPSNQTYGRGCGEYSSNGGSDWTSLTDAARMFKEWGIPGEVTYYFNARGDVVWTDPDNIVDNNLETFGYTNVNGSAQLLTGNDCPGTDLGTITKVELRLYSKGDGSDKIVVTPIFSGGDGDPHDTVPVLAPGDWTGYIDITNDTNHPDWSLLSHIQDLDCKLTFNGVGKKNTVHCSKVEIRVTCVPAVAGIGAIYQLRNPFGLNILTTGGK